MMSVMVQLSGDRRANFIWPRFEISTPGRDVEPRSETQCILLYLMGARLRASQENSQSRPNWFVARVHLERRWSLSCTYMQRASIITRSPRLCHERCAEALNWLHARVCMLSVFNEQKTTCCPCFYGCCVCRSTCTAIPECCLAR